MRKSVLSLILCLCMVAGLLSVTAFADEPVIVADTTWYNDVDTVFEIGSKEELTGLGVLSGTKSLLGKTIKLTADLSFDNDSIGISTMAVIRSLTVVLRSLAVPLTDRVIPSQT